MTDIIQSNWPQILGAVAAIVYALRVEGRLNHVETVVWGTQRGYAMLQRETAQETGEIGEQ